MKNGSGAYQQLTALMAMIGCKTGWDAVPVDVINALMDQTFSAYVRFLAWMVSSTTRLGRHSAWAINEQGRELTLSDLGRRFKMDHGNVGHYWRQLEKWGFVRREGQRLYLCGTVKTPLSAEAKEKRSGVCTYPWPDYILNAINKRGAEVRKAFDQRSKVIQTKDLLLERELAAVRRSMIEQDKDNLLSDFQIKKIPGKKRRPDSPPLLAALQPLLEGYVHTHGSAHTQNAGMSQPETGVRADSASLLIREKTDLREKKARAATANAGDSAASLSSLLYKQRQKRNTRDEEITLLFAFDEACKQGHADKANALAEQLAALRGSRG